MAERNGSNDPIVEAQGALKLSRRLILGLLASVAGVPKAFAELNAAIVRDGVLAQTGVLQKPSGQGGISVQSVVFIPVIRPDDLLVLGIVLRNLQVTSGPGQRQITLINPAEPGIMIVGHQPQSILEQAFADPGDPTNPNQPPPNYPPTPPGVSGSRLAGASYIAYQTPSGFTSWPFTLSDLLNAFSVWPMRLDVNAQPLPSDPLGIGASLHEFDTIKASLASAAFALKSKLSVTQSKAMVKALERAGQRVTSKLSDAARQGRRVGGADLNTAVASEVNTAFAKKTASAGDRMLASNYVEAVAGVGIIAKYGPGLSVSPQPTLKTSWEPGRPSCTFPATSVPRSSHSGSALPIWRWPS